MRSNCSAMAKPRSMHLSYFLLAFVVIPLAIGLLCEAIDDVEKKVYIVYMGSLPKEEGYSAKSHHIRMLQALGDDKIKNLMEEKWIRSYSRSFNGFVAHLTSHEAKKLESMEEVVSVFENSQYQTQTTRSWDYLGFSQEVQRNPSVESDIIIGVIDSGITPESESFSDQGLDEIPKKWKGVCQGGKNFTCNKKLIGARHYTYKDARDYNGHGTHTASTAAGREVANTSFFGIGNGTVRGAVPGARIATYKACGKNCDSLNVLAAFDDAIADGVDIITASLGASEPIPLSVDVVSIGSFHAMANNILTLQSGGNNGTGGLESVISSAPWLVTVAASSIDRKIINKAVLGNQRTYISAILNAFPSINNDVRLVHGRQIGHSCNQSNAMKCFADCIDLRLVKGKIVVCDADDSSGVLDVVTYIGAAGVILIKNKMDYDVAFNVPLPLAALHDSDFHRLISYLNSTSLPYGRITKSEAVPLEKCPAVAGFSAKGPSKILPQILKPDIAAPGINILAAFSPLGKISEYGTDDDKRRANFNFLSGTSMSCPHVAGAAAYVKSMHPRWSPSAIKSALMTTASPMNVSYNVDAELGYGAGQLNPLKALHPGLVYEAFVDDYTDMFCSLGSEGEKLIKMSEIKRNCREGKVTSPKDLNYPSMIAAIKKNSSFNIQFPRVVKNVGHPNSTYHAEITTGHSAIHVSVEPSILSFVSFRETKSFVVTVSGEWLNQDHISCSLVWSDGTYRVRSPIILYRNSIV